MDRKYTVLTISLLVLTAVLGLLIFLWKQSMRYAPVQYGISMAEARKVVDNQEEWFLVEAYYTTGLRFRILYGSNQGTDVELSGASPSSQLSSAFFLGNVNYFLIKGTEHNVNNIGRVLEINLPDNYTIEVDEWQIITPIRRDYTYRAANQKWRIFYPRNYFDEFDVVNQDFYPNGAEP